MPLRVPDLAPSLGRVLVPRRVAEPWVPIDDIREALATRVLELGGEARAAAEREDRERVLETVSRRAWLAAWEQAVRRAADRVTHALDGRIERAARAVAAVGLAGAHPLDGSRRGNGVAGAAARWLRARSGMVGHAAGVLEGCVTTREFRRMMQPWP